MRANAHPYTEESVARWVRRLSDNALLVAIDRRGYSVAERLRPYLEGLGVRTGLRTLKSSAAYAEVNGNGHGYRLVEGFLEDPEMPDSPVTPIERIREPYDLALVTDDLTDTFRTLLGGCVCRAEYIELSRRGRVATYAEKDVDYPLMRRHALPTFSHNGGIGLTEHALRRARELAPVKVRQLNGRLGFVPDGELDKLRNNGDSRFMYYWLGV